MNKSMLEKRLEETGYAALFLYGARSEANSFWQNGARQNELEEIVYNDHGPQQAKFLAAEILRTNGISLHPGLAQVYAMALKHSAEEVTDHWQVNANAWAQLFETIDAGPLGQQLISFGMAAMPHLQPLLNDNNTILYEGSEEATLGNVIPFRVKDFAAYFISRIRNVPLQLAGSHAERDRAIEQLKTHI